jgi:hypothetical protein
MHAVIREELWPPIAEVALPFAIIGNLDAILGLTHTAFLRMYAISWPSIASTNWEGRQRRSSPLASTGMMKVYHPSVVAYAGSWIAGSIG